MRKENRSEARRPKRGARITRRGKITASVLVLLGGGAIFVAAMYWEALVTEYHVHRLRRDPELFVAMLRQPPEDRLQKTALHRCLRTPQGGILLCETFLDDLFTFLEPQDPDFLPRFLPPGQIVAFGLYRVGTRPSSVPYFLIDGPRTLTKPLKGHPETVRLVELFRFVDHREFESASYPGVKFTMWGYEDDLDENEVIVEGRMVRERSVPTAVGPASPRDR